MPRRTSTKGKGWFGEVLWQLPVYLCVSESDRARGETQCDSNALTHTHHIELMESDKDVSQAQTLDESGASLTETARGPQSPHEGPHSSLGGPQLREILSYEGITL